MGYMDDLRNRAAQGFAPGWKPEPGDEIMGVVEDVDQIEKDPRFSKEGGHYHVVTVHRILNDRVTDERVAIHAMHTSLDGSIARKFPHPGGVLFVKYEGRRINSKTEMEFHSYQYVYDANPPEHLRIGSSAPARAPQQQQQPAPAPVSAPAGPPSSDPFF